MNRGLAARLGSCASSTTIPLIALIPEDIKGGEQQDEQELKVDLTTTQAYPTFWFYLPYSRFTNEARFIVLDANKNPILKAPIKIELPENQTNRIAEFTLPNTEKPLEVGKQYTWSFEIVCNPTNPDRNPIVRGQIKRIEDLPQNSQPGNQLPGYLVSANNRVVWYDTLTQLARNNTLYSQDWMTLLRGSGIPQFVAQQPIVKLKPGNGLAGRRK